MNARQKCKKLKQRNKLLMNIVTGNSDFLRVLNIWTKQPLNVVYSSVQLNTYAARCSLEPMLGDNARRFAEDCIIRKLSEDIKRNVEWKIIDHDTPCMKLEGRIMIAEKGCD